MPELYYHLSRRGVDEVIGKYLLPFKTQDEVHLVDESMERHTDYADLCIAALPLLDYTWVKMDCNQTIKNAYFICEKKLLLNRNNVTWKSLSKSSSSCPKNMHLANSICISVNLFSIENNLPPCSHLTNWKKESHIVFTKSQNVLLTKLNIGHHINMVLCSISQKEKTCGNVKFSGIKRQRKKEWYYTEGNCETQTSYLNTSFPVYTEITCSLAQFKCTDGTCILKHHVCDGESDCLDASEELQCGHVCKLKGSNVATIDCYSECYPRNCTCHPLYFQCSGGGCIPASKWCDSKTNCKDSSDEIMCSFNSASTAHHVDEVPLSCFPMNDLNTGPCKAGCLKCSYDSLECYPVSAVCVYDRDEENNPLFCSNTEHLQFCETHECPEHFKCPNSYCIPMNRVCDKKIDCPNAEDESGCDSLECVGLLKCKGDNVCIHPINICDGRVDCKLSEDDEILCNVPPCPVDCICHGLATQCSIFNANSQLATQLKVLILKKANVILLEQSFHDYTSTLLLDMSQCSIQNLPSNIFINLINLKILDLRENAISVLDHSFSTGLQSLHQLNLRMNSLHHLKSHSFLHLKILENLDLKNMLISLIDNYAFDGMLLLSTLNLSFNHITYLSKHTFVGLSDNLKYLDLSGNPLLTINIEVFKHLHALEWIALSESKLCCYVKLAEICLPINNDIFFMCGDILQSSLLKVASWFLGSLSCSFNILVIYYNFKTKHLSSQTTLITSFAFSDLLMGLYMIILAFTDIHFHSVYDMYYDTWITSALCRALGMTCITSFQVSLFSVFLISLNQYLVICRGLKSLSQSTHYVWVMLGFCWIVPIIVSVAWASLDDHIIRNSLCLPFPPQSKIVLAALSLFLVFDLALIFLIVILYKSILEYVKISSQHVQRSGKQSTFFMKLKFLLSFFGSFSTRLMFTLIAMIPFWIEDTNPITYAWLAILTLPQSSILNPIFHTFLTKTFLQNFLRRLDNNIHGTSQSVDSAIK